MNLLWEEKESPVAALHVKLILFPLIVASKADGFDDFC
jgi:hypothetical protein